MILAHKIALDPNDKQRTYFMRASGTARFAYNWALVNGGANIKRAKSLRKSPCAVN
jgi:hypothetical protein